MSQATPIAPADSHSMLIRGDVSLCATSELLAVVLRTGPASAQAMTAAECLLEHFGGLRAVLNAHWEQLAAAPGVGDARLAKIRAMRELARRYFEEPLPIPRHFFSHACATARTRCSAAFIWITAIGLYFSRRCFVAPLMALASTHAKWSRWLCRSLRPWSSWHTIIHRGLPIRARQMNVLQGVSKLP